MEINDITQRDSFTGRIGIIAAVAGSAVGLGNIWKFPYITGVFGGGAFVLVYLLCIAIIGLPVMLSMLSEFTIGRKAQRNAVGSFKKLAPGKPWFLTGVMGIAAAFMILAFYGVVAGWTLEYLGKAVINSFAGKNPADLEGMFGGFISQVIRPIFWQFIFMGLTCWIVLAGIKGGIEKASKILMPVLLLIIVILDIRAITLPGAGEGLSFLFKPDFSKLSAEGVLSALGHAFFSLSLGMGTLITYSSYMGKNENLGSMAIQCTVADTGIALLAGIAIFPAVFAFGIEPGAGPGLVFITLPNVFQQMPGGYIFSLIPCSLSMGAMSKVQFLGKTFFDWLDYIAANILLPIGGLLIVAFVGWYLGYDKTKEEITNAGKLKAAYLPLFLFLAKFIAPLVIAIVFLHGLGLF